ncbi:unnamed protein product [Rotaria magnacalcarata]|uniref:Uncharacterized protein n=1 Tax=Rotaria magnacalcarata TaxID=392030 RepID=A0A819FTQ8_9BILA|nr:unnamed protein product [Rotaria magnacalcarata]CAF3872167.1 unnamed protein product [Rotaria magnacalcarata]
MSNKLYAITNLSSAPIAIGLALILVGFCRAAASPLTYESLTEIMFPHPKSLLTSALVQVINVSAVILLFSASERYKLTNLIVVISNVLSIILVGFVQV